jgi:hypothetical protein
MRFVASLLAVAVSFGAGMSIPRNAAATGLPAPQTTRNTSGPFRDGLYLGGLAATSGETPHISSGRWSTSANQEAFAAGYEQGYQGAK